MKFYKIRNKQTGLWSRGGMDPRFDKLGKVWRTAGHVKQHLNQYKTDGYCLKYHPDYLDSIEVVLFDASVDNGVVVDL